MIARHGLAKESVLFFPRVTGTNSYDKVDSIAHIHLEGSSDLGHGSSKQELVNLVARSYTEGSDEYLSRSSAEKGIFLDLDDASLTSADTNDDMKMLLKCTSPLLWSQNSAVVLAATGVHWIMASKDDVNRIVKPLLFVLRSSRASKYVVGFLSFSFPSLLLLAYCNSP